MRRLLVLCTLGACDPVWHVANVTKPTPPTATNEACVDAALHETDFAVSNMGENAPKRGWYVSSRTRQLRVTWDPEQPQSLTLLMLGVGTRPPPNALESYRFMRDAVLVKVNARCGPFDAGPEHCLRMHCSSKP